MDLSQQLAAAGLVLALCLFVAKAAQRRGWLRLDSAASRSGPRRELERVERFILGPHHHLHLMRVEGRTFLIATHPQGVQLVPLTTQAVGRGGTH